MDNKYFVNLDPEYLEQEIEKAEGRVTKSLASDVAAMTGTAEKSAPVRRPAGAQQRSNTPKAPSVRAAGAQQRTVSQAETVERPSATQTRRPSQPSAELYGYETVRPKRNPLLVDSDPIDDDDDDDDEITEEEYLAMKARKAAEKSQSDLAVEEERQSEYRPRRTSSGNGRAPQGNRPYAGRQGAQGNRPASRRSREDRLLDEKYGASEDRRQRPVAKKRKLPIFWICLGVYALILIILAWRFLAYTDKCLVQYENSQSDNAIQAYLTEFKAKVADGSITEELTLPSASGEFEAADVYKNIYMAQFDNVNRYSCEKDSGSYLTEEPVYDILADDTLVAKVTLQAKNERTIFGILTIMDWEVKEIQPVFTAGSHDYIIKVPNDYTVTINGVTLSDNYLTGNSEQNPDFANVIQYVSMPTVVEYKVTDLVNEPEIKVYDGTGAEVAYTPDENGNITVDYVSASAEMPQELYDDALEMAQTWEDFLTNDLSGESHGLATIQQYLIKDSYYWEMADSYAHGIDITFISDHTLLDPPYSNISITDYVSYGENCYSCHIYFEKNMYLTRTGETRVDTIDSTFYFVKYDDSDDGVDNPHWAIVDMIATTN
ncbi:MAG: hypothetical protein ACI39R_06060 [Lachnospiraceae bacterium]